MLYSYSYRLYPNRQQTIALEDLLELHRELYNAALEERREAWRRSRVSLNYYDQANQLKAIRTLRTDVAALNYSACQQTLRRLNKAYQAFFRRVRSGDTPATPASNRELGSTRSPLSSATGRAVAIIGSTSRESALSK